MVFRGNEGGEGGSVVANRVERGLQSTFIAWEGWDRGFLRVTWFSEELNSQ